jgi:hypothetical protein
VPWDVGGDYSKPIPRRIIEEAGVPRGTFGVSKRATAVVLWNPREGFLPLVDLEDLKRWLADKEQRWASIGATSPLAKMRRARLVSILFAPVRPVLAVMRRIPVARSIARRIIALDPRRRPDPLFHALFPWALDRAKARYNDPSEGKAACLGHAGDTGRRQAAQPLEDHQPTLDRT